jgi:hypothetical protein
VTILELQDLPAVKNREAIPTSCIQRDPFEFALGPQPIVKLVAGTRSTLEIDLVGAALDLVVSGSLARRGVFPLLSGFCLTLIPFKLECQLAPSHIWIFYECSASLAYSSVIELLATQNDIGEGFNFRSSHIISVSISPQFDVVLLRMLLGQIK